MGEPGAERGPRAGTWPSAHPGTKPGAAASAESEQGQGWGGDSWRARARPQPHGARELPTMQPHAAGQPNLCTPHPGPVCGTATLYTHRVPWPHTQGKLAAGGVRLEPRRKGEARRQAPSRACTVSYWGLFWSAVHCSNGLEQWTQQTQWTGASPYILPSVALPSPPSPPRKHARTLQPVFTAPVRGMGGMNGCINESMEYR